MAFELFHIWKMAIIMLGVCNNLIFDLFDHLEAGFEVIF